MLLCFFRLGILAFGTGEGDIERLVTEDNSGAIGAPVPISVCHMGVLKVLRMARAGKQSIQNNLLCPCTGFAPNPDLLLAEES